MLRQFFLFLAILVVSSTCSLAQEEGKYSIKIMTSQVRQALDARKERFSQLQSLKAADIIGENNHGYAELLKENIEAKTIVAEENKDRLTIYRTIAQQNDFEDQISTIELAFGAIKKEKANPGEMIQTESGEWVKK